MNPTEATALFAEARKVNPFVEELLVSGRPLPFKGEEVDSYTMGSLEEAVLCMESVGDAWRRSADALAWLRDNAAPQNRREVVGLLHATHTKRPLRMERPFCENRWSRKPDSNRRPADYESAALPTELLRLALVDCIVARHFGKALEGLPQGFWQKISIFFARSHFLS
jgi:hypothetical protein